jgi:hypothetical protein
MDLNVADDIKKAALAERERRRRQRVEEARIRSEALDVGAITSQPLSPSVEDSRPKPVSYGALNSLKITKRKRPESEFSYP